MVTSNQGNFGNQDGSENIFGCHEGVGHGGTRFGDRQRQSQDDGYFHDEAEEQGDDDDYMPFNENFDPHAALIGHVMNKNTSFATATQQNDENADANSHYTDVNRPQSRMNSSFHSLGARSAQEDEALALRYLLRYEGMVRSQQAEEMATVAHLQPCLERLCELLATTTTRTNKQSRNQSFSMDSVSGNSTEDIWNQEISFDDLRRVRTILQSGIIQQRGKKLAGRPSSRRPECMTTDMQLMFVLDLLTQRHTTKLPLTEQKPAKGDTLQACAGTVEAEGTLSWAEIVQCYRICIVGMTALQQVSDESSATKQKSTSARQTPPKSLIRSRIRDRTMAMLAMFEPKATKALTDSAVARKSEGLLEAETKRPSDDTVSATKTPSGCGAPSKNAANGEAHGKQLQEQLRRQQVSSSLLSMSKSSRTGRAAFERRITYLNQLELKRGRQMRKIWMKKILLAAMGVVGMIRMYQNGILDELMFAPGDPDVDREDGPITGELNSATQDLFHNADPVAVHGKLHGRFYGYKPTSNRFRGVRTLPDHGKKAPFDWTRQALPVVPTPARHKSPRPAQIQAPKPDPATGRRGKRSGNRGDSFIKPASPPSSKISTRKYRYQQSRMQRQGQLAESEHRAAMLPLLQQHRKRFSSIAVPTVAILGGVVTSLLGLPPIMTRFVLPVIEFRQLPTVVSVIVKTAVGGAAGLGVTMTVASLIMEGMACMVSLVSRP